jgi:hypothetical protein
MSVKKIKSKNNCYKNFKEPMITVLKNRNLSFIGSNKDDYQTDIVKWYIQKNEIKLPIKKTKKGYLYFFKQFSPNNEPFNNTNYLSALGVNLTAKSGDNIYVLIKPSEYKQWIKESEFNNLPEIPEGLKPLNKNNKNEIVISIIRNIAFCWQTDLLKSYDDIELSFCHFLINEGFKDNYIYKAFKFIYSNYDHSKINLIIERAKKELNNRKKVNSDKLFYEKIKNNPIFQVLNKLFELYFSVKNKTSTPVNIQEIKKIEADLLENLESIETLDSFPEFPLGVFPEPFQNLVSNIAESYNVPVELPAATLLFLSGGCIGATRQIQITENFKIYPNIYMAIIAESGMRKSPPIKYMLKALRIKDKELIDHFKAKFEEYEKKLEIYKIEKADFERKAKKKGIELTVENFPTPPEKPVDKKYLIDDITIEKLAESLAANNRGLLSYHDELRSLLSGFGKYSKTEAAENEKSFFDKCFDGEYYKYERKSSDTIVLTRPIMSIYGAIQPEVFKYSFKNKDLMSGFFQRWVFYHIPKEKMNKFVGISNQTVSSDNQDMLSKYINYLLQFEFDKANNPINIKLETEAFEIFNEYYIKLQNKMIYDAVGNGFTGFLSKARNLPAKFALHLLSMGSFLIDIPLDENIYIPAKIMQLGCIISDWFIEHTKSMWQYYLDDISLHIQPVDEMILEALVSLFEEGKAEINIILTSEIKEWLEKKRNVSLSSKKIASLLKKFTISRDRVKSKRGWIVSQEIIKIVKNKILNNVLNVADVADNNITDCNNNKNNLVYCCQIENNVADAALTKQGKTG